MKFFSPKDKFHFWQYLCAVLFLAVAGGGVIRILIARNRNFQEHKPPAKKQIRRDIQCELREDGIIYCRWFRCELDTADFFIEFIRTFPEHKGIIVDLRGNAGGSLPEGIAFAGLWYEKKSPLITLYRRKNGPEVAAVKSLSKKELKTPVVAIIDENTASTAEVVAGLISALPQGWLVGQKTAGDPVARVDIIAGDPPRSMEMRLMIRLHNRPVHNDGIIPDYIIKPGEFFGKQCLEKAVLILNNPPGDNL